MRCIGAGGAGGAGNPQFERCIVEGVAGGIGGAMGLCDAPETPNGETTAGLKNGYDRLCYIYAGSFLTLAVWSCCKSV